MTLVVDTKWYDRPRIWVFERNDQESISFDEARATRTKKVRVVSHKLHIVIMYDIHQLVSHISYKLTRSLSVLWLQLEHTFSRIWFQIFLLLLWITLNIYRKISNQMNAWCSRFSLITLAIFFRRCECFRLSSFKCEIEKLQVCDVTRYSASLCSRMYCSGVWTIFIRWVLNCFTRLQTSTVFFCSSLSTIMSIPMKVPVRPAPALL